MQVVQKATEAELNRVVARELERLKRSLVSVERTGADRFRQISLVYRVADRFASRLFPLSFCHAESARTGGCSTGKCCRCRPDVFDYEKQVLDLLPKRCDDTGFCPFFNLRKKICGIYGVRPFACRLYYNLGRSAYYCQNPDDATLQLFDSVKRHLEKTLGPYRGGYDGR